VRYDARIAEEILHFIHSHEAMTVALAERHRVPSRRRDRLSRGRSLSGLSVLGGPRSLVGGEAERAVSEAPPTRTRSPRSDSTTNSIYTDRDGGKEGNASWPESKVAFPDLAPTFPNFSGPNFSTQCELRVDDVGSHFRHGSTAADLPERRAKRDPAPQLRRMSCVD
jgi:hypothetical protein